MTREIAPRDCNEALPRDWPSARRRAQRHGALLRPLRARVPREAQGGAGQPDVRVSEVQERESLLDRLALIVPSRAAIRRLDS